MRKEFFKVVIALSVFVIMASCDKKEDHVCPSPLAPLAKTGPLYQFSITSNDIDFITSTDPDAFESLTYVGQDKKEMPGGPVEGVLFDENSYVFKATFTNGKEIGVWCHSSFESKGAAENYANKLCPRLGKLPEVQRDMLHHVVIHTGDETAFAETEGNFFVLYAENMDTRIGYNDLEETVFHESVHASLQKIHENTSAWRIAQVSDGNFITEYALGKPSLEDMPESAIFCYTVIKYPGRLSTDVENWIKDYIPNRLEFFSEIYE